MVWVGDRIGGVWRALRALGRRCGCKGETKIPLARGVVRITGG